jgi:nucleoside-diphosphate-sugar epimerase
MHTILGINGATGLEIAKELQRRNLPVRGISRRPYPGPWEHIQADVMQRDPLTQALDGATTVYCCVGLEYNIKVWQRDWPVLIENIIAACLANNAQLVFIDNVYMYGLVEGEMTENTPMRPTSKKGIVRKQVSEILLHAFAERGLRGCIARAADFYGPNCEKSMIAEGVFKNIAKGRAMQWLGRLDKYHAFTYTPDIGRACVNLATSNLLQGDVWHLPTAKAVTAHEFTTMVAEELGTAPKVTAIRGFMVTVLGWFIPILREVKEMMYQYDHDYRFSSAKYEQAFNESPTPYHIGIKNTVAAEGK